MAGWRPLTPAPPASPQEVEERFRRNTSRPAGEDVAKRAFLLDEGKIQLTFHLEHYATIPSKRVFTKPLAATDSRRAEDFTGAHLRTFQVETVESALQASAPLDPNGRRVCRPLGGAWRHAPQPAGALLLAAGPAAAGKGRSSRCPRVP